MGWKHLDEAKPNHEPSGSLRLLPWSLTRPRAQLIVFGGQQTGGGGNELNDTWTYDLDDALGLAQGRRSLRVDQ